MAKKAKITQIINAIYFNIVFNIVLISILSITSTLFSIVTCRKYDIDFEFYNALNYNLLSEIIPVYNRTRNYLTQKPYSLEKFNEYKWEIVYKNEDYDSSKEEFDALTEFESRYKSEGIKIKRLILKNTKQTLKEIIEENKETETK